MDDPSISLGEKQFGSSAALPIFARSIKGIYDLEHYYINGEREILIKDLDWERPSDILNLSVCSETNKKSTEICSQKKEIFLKNNQPVEMCDRHATPLSRFKNN